MPATQVAPSGPAIPTDADAIASLSLEDLHAIFNQAVVANNGLTIQSLADDATADADNAAAAKKRAALYTILPLMERHQDLMLGSKSKLKAVHDDELGPEPDPEDALIGIREIDWALIPEGTLPFLCFPNEIQERILRYAFRRTKPVYVDSMLNGFSDFDKMHGSHAALLTCRHMYHSHLRTFLSSNAFCISLRRMERERFQTHFVEQYPYHIGQPVSWANIPSVIVENPTTHGGFDFSLRVLLALQCAPHRRFPLQKITFDLRMESEQHDFGSTTIEEPASEKTLEILEESGVKTQGCEITVLEHWYDKEQTHRTYWQEKMLEPELKKGLDRGVDGLTMAERKEYLKEHCKASGKKFPVFKDELEFAQAEKENEIHDKHRAASDVVEIGSFVEVWGMTHKTDKGLSLEARSEVEADSKGRDAKMSRPSRRRRRRKLKNWAQNDGN